MVGAPWGKGGCNINGCSIEFTMLIQALFGFLLLPLVLLVLSPGPKSLVIPSIEVVPSIFPSVWYMNFMQDPRPSFWSTPPPAVGLLFILSSNSALFSPAVMPWPRKQMLNRWETSRGGSSRPSVEEETSHHCHFPHAEGGRFLWPSQFLDVSSPGSSSSPSFGSAIFTFNSSLKRPQINAHVSVLFFEEAQEEGESSAQQETIPIADTTRAMETPSADPTKVTKRPSSQNEDVKMEPVTTATEEVQAQDLEEYGWWRIVEEAPED